MATWYVNKSGFDATYVFTCSGVSTAPVATNTYTNNGVTFTVVGMDVSKTYLFCTGAGAPAASGNLVRVTGSGDDPIAFTSYVASGSTVTGAKLTIQAAVTAAVSTDTIIVGSGLYNERVNLTTKALNLYAAGVVVMDGTTGSLAAPAIYSTGNMESSPMAISGDPTVGGRWIIRGYVGNSAVVYLLPNVSGRTASLTLANLFLVSNANSSGLSFYATVSNVNAPIYITNCTFIGFTYGILCQETNSYYLIPYVTYCSFYNNTIALYVSSSYYTILTSVGNIISNSTSAYYIGAGDYGMSALMAKNIYYTVTNWRAGATTYSTFASWQAAGYDSTSFQENPNFVDPTNNVLYIKSPTSVGRQSGDYQVGFTRGANYNPDADWNVGNVASNAMWYSADGNVAKNGTTNYLELVAGTSGIVDSPVYDLGSVQLIKQVNLALDQSWPTNMVDKEINDVRPNYQTIEIRASGDAFDQDDVAIAWTEVKTEIPITAIGGRYVQLRLTLRSNDVAG